MKNIIIIFCLVASFFSCSPLRSIERKSTIQSLSDITFASEHLTGYYGNKPDSSSRPYLWKEIYYNAEQEVGVDSTAFVRLVFRSEQKLKLDLIDKYGELKDKVILSGKIKNGYFELATQYKLKMIFPGFWAFGSHIVRIAIDKDDNLIVDRNSSGMGFLVILPFFGSDFTTSNSYEKVQKMESNFKSKFEL